MKKNKKILWGSPHIPTAEQLEELKKEGEIFYLKDFSEIPSIWNTPDEEGKILKLASAFLGKAKELGFDYIVQPAGSPAFQFALGMVAGRDNYPTILFAHSERVSKEKIKEDGTVEKVSIFEHRKFLKMELSNIKLDGGK